MIIIVIIIIIIMTKTTIIRILVRRSTSAIKLNLMWLWQLVSGQL